MDLFKIVGRLVFDNKDAVDGMKQTSKQAKDMADDMTEANSDMNKSTGDASTGMSGAFKKIGTAVVTYLSVQAIKDFGGACLDAAAEMQATASQFAQVFGDSEGQAAESLAKIAGDAGILENRMKGSYTKIAAFAKTTGMDTADALELSNRAMVAVADSAAFYDRSLEETTESLQSFLKGNFENDAALGLSCTETTRNAAANKLYGKSFIELSESQKQLTLLKMVEDANKTSGAMGQAARESDTWTNQTGNLTQAWNDFKALLGTNFLPMAVDVIKKMTKAVIDLSAKIPEAIKWFKENKNVIIAVASAVAILVAGIKAYNTVQAIKALMAAKEVTTVWALVSAYAAQAAATIAAVAPYVLIVAAIAAVIAIVVLLIKNWDKVKAACAKMFDSLKNTWNKIKTTASNVWNGIKDAISKPITAAMNFVKGIIDKIKGFFSFKISWPKIPLPHFGLKPKGWSIGDLLKGEIPSLAIDWYAKAMDNPMILTKPTVFGYDASTGSLMGGGEAGNEVVAGQNTLMHMIQGAVAGQNEPMLYYMQKLVEILATYFPQILTSMERDFVFDDGIVAARLAVPMDRELGKIKDRKDRGR